MYGGAPGTLSILLFTAPAHFSCMKRSFSFGILMCGLLLAMVAVAPAFGFVTPAATKVPSGITVAAPVDAKPTISATVSAAAPVVGDPVTISGVLTGGSPVNSVNMWVFAGNYVDVSTVLVNRDGTYSKTFNTAGLPPATYYVFVQSPGNDGLLNIRLEDTGNYSGQVVDAKDGSLLFNFTGTGSVQDAAASTALAETLTKRDADDVYTKTTFSLVAPATAAVATADGEPAAAAEPAATPKSPLPSGLAVLSLALAALGTLARAGKR